MMFKSKWLVAAVLLSLTLVACTSQTSAPVGGPAAAPAAPKGQAPQPSLEELAKQEGKMTFYCAADTKVCETMANAFDSEHGVKVSVLRQPGGVLMERFRADAARNEIRADVFLDSNISSFLSAMKDGLLAPFEFAHEYPVEEYKHLIPYGYPTMITTMALIYNTKLVTDQQRDLLATSYNALLDPAFTGKITSGDPAQSGSTFNFYWGLKEIMGEAAFWPWVEGMAKQKVAFFASAVPPVDATIRGEFAIALSGEHNASRAVADGAPVSVVYPASSAPGSMGAIGLPKGAPNPNAGKLFIQWFNSREGQTLWTKTYHLMTALPNFPDARPLAKAHRFEAPKRVLLISDPVLLAEQAAAPEEFLKRFSRLMGL